MYLYMYMYMYLHIYIYKRRWRCQENNWSLSLPLSPPPLSLSIYIYIYVYIIDQLFSWHPHHVCCNFNIPQHMKNTIIKMSELRKQKLFYLITPVCSGFMKTGPWNQTNDTNATHRYTIFQCEPSPSYLFPLPAGRYSILVSKMELITRHKWKFSQRITG